MRIAALILLCTTALAADPEFVPDYTDPAHVACQGCHGSSWFWPTGPYATWRDVGVVADVSPSVEVECELDSAGQSQGVEIRMNSTGDVQMRAQVDATAGAACVIRQIPDEEIWRIVIGD